MPYRIARVGYVEIRSLDLERDVDWYVNVVGLRLDSNERTKVYLRGWDEKHAYSVVLRQADSAGLDRLAFRTVDAEDVEYYEHRLRTLGVPFDVVPADHKRGKALRFDSPSGHVVELYHEMDYTGGLLSEVNPTPWPLVGLTGIAPPRLDHVLVTAPDPAKAIRFFRDVLEFRLSEFVGKDPDAPIAGFLRQRPTPHDLAIVPGRPGGFHHAAFAIDSAEAIFRAADILTASEAKIDYFGRHGITRGTTIYFFDPSGNRLETFGAYANYQPDSDQRPIQWTEDKFGTGVFYYTREVIPSFLSVYT
jgi:catechol 2,3-dioxygenase